ncbi:hypothetical protein QUF72_18175 [Desulfobacterales bacterium HSG2]|nr:hypothetical protein [Desulfobacterales bacterium HSG2]
MLLLLLFIRIKIKSKSKIKIKPYDPHTKAQRHRERRKGEHGKIYGRYLEVSEIVKC